MKDHERPTPTRCPHCGYLAEVDADVFDEAPPVDGDVSLCIRCGRVSIFDATAVGGRRTATDAESERIGKSPDVRRAVSALRRAIASRPS